MKIIILGAGQVGSSVADNLVREPHNDITVIDQNATLLHNLQNHLDIRTIHGHCAYPSILKRAGADDAEMIIAVTNSDEINMVACQIAYTLFHTPTKIARIRASAYLKGQSLFNNKAFAIDYIISPEQIVTDYIQRLIEHPGALQVLDFADGRVGLVAVHAYNDGPLVGHELSELNQHMPNIDARVAAIFRENRPITPEGDTVIKVGDEVFFIAARNHIPAVMSELRKLEKPVKRVILAGGGNIGKRLAKALEHKYQVKIIERSVKRAHFICEELEKTIILQGDASDKELLVEENISHTSVFCALTNDDEANILSAMLAKRLGAEKVMSIINRPAYVDLMEGGLIDVAISPRQASIGSLLTHVRRGDVVAVHSLRRGAAEALEAIAHGDKSNSKVVGRRIEDIQLPTGTTIGAIVRKDQVIMAHHNTVIETDDHVILFLVNKRYISQVEQLFQVSVTFL